MSRSKGKRLTPEQSRTVKLLHTLALQANGAALAGEDLAGEMDDDDVKEDFESLTAATQDLIDKLEELLHRGF
jgi:hypothetical protein